MCRNLYLFWRRPAGRLARVAVWMRLSKIQPVFCYVVPWWCPFYHVPGAVWLALRNSSFKCLLATLIWVPAALLVRVKQLQNKKA